MSGREHAPTPVCREFEPKNIAGWWCTPGGGGVPGTAPVGVCGRGWVEVVVHSFLLALWPKPLAVAAATGARRASFEQGQVAFCALPGNEARWLLPPAGARTPTATATQNKYLDVVSGWGVQTFTKSM